MRFLIPILALFILFTRADAQQVNTFYVSSTDTFKYLPAGYDITSSGGANTFIVDSPLAVAFDTMNIQSTRSYAVGRSILDVDSLLLLYNIFRIHGGNDTVEIIVDGISRALKPINRYFDGSGNLWIYGKTDSVQVKIKSSTLTEYEVNLTAVSFATFNYIRNVTRVNQFRAKNKFSLYPNPVEDYLNVEIDRQVELLKYKVFTLSGCEIKQGSIEDHQLDVSDLERGSYFLELNIEGQKRIERFVKE